jgi:hypothetical protein
MDHDTRLALHPTLTRCAKGSSSCALALFPMRTTTRKLLPSLTPFHPFLGGCRLLYCGFWRSWPFSWYLKIIGVGRAIASYIAELKSFLNTDTWSSHSENTAQRLLRTKFPLGNSSAPPQPRRLFPFRQMEQLYLLDWAGIIFPKGESLNPSILLAVGSKLIRIMARCFKQDGPIM